MILETGYMSPNGKFTAFVQDQYDITKKNINFIAQTYLNVAQQSFGLGFNNFANYTSPDSKYQTQADRFTFTTTWGLRPKNSRWALDAGIDFSFYRKHFDSFNKLLRLSREFHDARIEATVRHRNENLSFAVRFNILCGQGNRKKDPNPDTYFYPWMDDSHIRN